MVGNGVVLAELNVFGGQIDEREAGDRPNLIEVGVENGQLGGHARFVKLRYPIPVRVVHANAGEVDTRAGAGVGVDLDNLAAVAVELPRVDAPIIGPAGAHDRDLVIPIEIEGSTKAGVPPIADRHFVV